ncbi:hypothetical protein SFRURICE_002511 [Spodoptera frugiperda]|nr:hypothetical protein SFRURICE_002511 [Spodoptera frugiperda]
MSFVFRKPKKIQRRMFCADDDEDGEPEAPPPPVISQEKEKEKKEVKSVKSTLLSFADEEEEGEVFKVKKSSQSKRLAKKREKEKQKSVRTDGDSNKYESNMPEEKNNHTEENSEKPKPGKKKVTLEGLILAGREALAADGAGDVSDDSAAEEEADEDERGFHRYRAESVRAALLGAPGRIPDAALIHAARKTRQQARELGGDYIPVKPSEAGPGSRLVRDDGSGDDEEEGRILVRGLDLPTDKPKRGTAAVSEEELDSEAEEWEEQQLQKARPVIADLTGESVMDVNPFSVALPAPQMSAPEHLRPLTTTGTQPPSTANELVDALKKRTLSQTRIFSCVVDPKQQTISGLHKELLTRYTWRGSRLASHRANRAVTFHRKPTFRTFLPKELKERLLTSARIRESRASRCGELDAAYRRAQAIRGYLTDLIECLDEKLPQLEALEARALALHKRRCEFLIERRRADLRDQAQDVLAPPGRATKAAENEEKTRRAAEREGRRRARRLRREACAAAAAAHIPHRDGDSSDDDLPPAELHHYSHERGTTSPTATGTPPTTTCPPPSCTTTRTNEVRTPSLAHPPPRRGLLRRRPAPRRAAPLLARTSTSPTATGTPPTTTCPPRAGTTTRTNEVRTPSLAHPPPRRGLLRRRPAPRRAAPLLARTSTSPTATGTPPTTTCPPPSCTTTRTNEHIPHRDGDSSDDDLPPAELHHYSHERATRMWAWRSAAGVVSRLARWRARSPQLYADAYVADCLPKLIAPYVRHEISDDVRRPVGAFRPGLVGVSVGRRGRAGPSNGGHSEGGS